MMEFEFTQGCSAFSQYEPTCICRGTEPDRNLHEFRFRT